jgi:hypothetical protein
MNRFVWDLHASPLVGVARDYPISATFEDTPAEPRGPWVVPGAYRVRLTAGGETFERPLTVRMDPRITTPAAGLRRQYELSMSLASAMRGDSLLAARIRARLADVGGTPGASGELSALLGSERPGRGPGAAAGTRAPDLARVQGQLERLYELVQQTDAPPTPVVEAAARGALADLDGLRARCERALAAVPAGN